jgi:D-xylonolactonase
MERLAGGFGLLEGARWYPEWGLVFSDMTKGGVFALSPDNERPRPVIAHRKGIGGLVRHEAGGFVVAGRNVALKADGGGTEILLETRPDERFFNDLTADGRGRIFVGSVAIDPLATTTLNGGAPLGRLHRIDLDGSVHELADDVVTSNGLGSSPDDRLVYHADTGRRLIWAYGNRGAASGRECFASTDEYGEPDGLAVAENGSVWVAIAGGGVVVAWDSAGRRMAELPVPQPLVTSVCFGGHDLSTLYVLTGETPEHPDACGGCIWVQQGLNVRGLPGAVARVACPTSR